MRKGQTALVCPGCARKGVTFRFARISAEDNWTCRYCGWTCFDGGHDEIDVDRRVELAAMNPGRNDVPARWSAQDEIDAFNNYHH